MSGPDFDDVDKIINRNTILDLPAEGAASDRLNTAGLMIMVDGDTVTIDEPFPGTPLFQELQGFDFYADRPVTLDAVYLEVRDRPRQEFFYIPALLLLGVVIFMQRQRQQKQLAGKT